MVIAARASARSENLKEVLERSKVVLDNARPTAVNLMWATARMVDFYKELESTGRFDRDKCISLLEEEADFLAEQDVSVNRAMGRHGASLVKPGSNILHHCNTGSLATVDRGTAIGVIYEAHDQKKKCSCVGR